MPAVFRTQNLFSTPVLLSRLDEEEMNSALEKAILARRESHPGITRSNVGGWHSDVGLLRWGGPAARRLLNCVLEIVDKNTRSVDGQKAPFHWRAEAWANVNDRGSTNARHVHGGCYWSAVYYVRVDAGSGGELVLHDVRMPTLAMHAPRLRFMDSGGEREARMKPRAGMLVIFPSWLPHEVEAWDGDGLRISIAINLVALPPTRKAALKEREGEAKNAANLPTAEDI